MLPARREPDDFDPFTFAAWPPGLRPEEGLLAVGREEQGALGPPPPGAAIHVVVGTGIPTVQRADVHNGDLRYFRSDAGDGFVPLDRAGFADLPCYYAPSAHLGMPNHDDIIAAVGDLLRTGRTGALSTAPPASGPLVPDVPPAPPFGGRRGSALTDADLREAFDEFAGFCNPAWFT
jgi:hypothetical protein